MTDRREALDLELEYLKASDVFVKAKQDGKRGAAYDNAKTKMSELRARWRAVRDETVVAAGEARPAPVAASAQVKGG